jgi:rubrerythrin
VSIAAAVAERFAAARTDSGLFQAALFVEEVAALAYRAAAAGPLRGQDRAIALRFAGHEREHAAVFETLLFALTVPVREHATEADLEAVVPGLPRAGRDEALRALAQLESAAIAGHQSIGRRLEALDALRSVATVMAAGAQHLVVLRDALGQIPQTKPFETGR